MKNSILNKIINFLLISTFLLLINSCAYFRLKELDKHNFSEDNIYDLVSKEYKEFAYSELYERLSARRAILSPAFLAIVTSSCESLEKVLPSPVT